MIMRPKKNGRKPPISSTGFPIAPLGQGRRALPGMDLGTTLPACKGINDPHPLAEPSVLAAWLCSDPRPLPHRLLVPLLAHSFWGASPRCSQGSCLDFSKSKQPLPAQNPSLRTMPQLSAPLLPPKPPPAPSSYTTAPLPHSFSLLPGILGPLV